MPKEMISKSVSAKHVVIAKLPPGSVEKDGKVGPDSLQKAVQRAGIANSTGKGTTGSVGD